MEENYCNNNYSAMWFILAMIVMVICLCGYTLIYEWYEAIPYEIGETIASQFIK